MLHYILRSLVSATLELDEVVKEVWNQAGNWCYSLQILVLISFQEEQKSLYRDESVKSLDDFYDPCFLLQLFSELTRPGKVNVWYLM